MLKRITFIILSIVSCLLLTSCNASSFDVSELMSQPKPSGNLYEVQKALENYAGKDITLKYPVSGNYRSAFVIKDLTGDGVEEAVAFYSVKDEENSEVLHVNYIFNSKGKWVSKSDMEVPGSVIDEVSFANMDGDAISEIVIGSTLFSEAEKQLSVFCLKDGALVKRMQEKYTIYATADLNSDSKEEILIIEQNTAEKTASAKMFALEQDTVSEKGRSSLDGEVTNYYRPVVSKLSNGKTAVYIDANKGTSTLITEVIYWEDVLMTPLFDIERMANVKTARPSTVFIKDVNGDGIMEIPAMELLPASETLTDSERAYVTTWQDFDGQGFQNVSVVVINSIDGYYIDIPSEWIDKFTVVRKTEQKTRTFYKWDWETNLQTEEFLKLQMFSKEEWERDFEKYNQYEVVCENGKDVIVAKVTQGEDVLISMEQIKKSVHFIEEVKDS